MKIIIILLILTVNALCIEAQPDSLKASDIKNFLGVNSSSFTLPNHPNKDFYLNISLYINGKVYSSQSSGQMDASNLNRVSVIYKNEGENYKVLLSSNLFSSIVKLKKPKGLELLNFPGGVEFDSRGRHVLAVNPGSETITLRNGQKIPKGYGENITPEKASACLVLKLDILEKNQP